MSANNFLYIYRTKTPGHPLFRIEEKDADTGKTFNVVGGATELQDVIKLAQDYQSENEVEYGITFDKNVYE